MDKHKLTISFSKEYTDLYYFLKGKKDRSNYICNLLNKNIASSEDNKSEIEEVIEKTLTKILSRYDFSNININNQKDNNYNNNSQNNKETSQEDKNLINMLFK